MDTQQFKLYQEQTFDSFSKRTIRNEGIDAHRELAYRAKHEIQLSTLSESELAQLSTEDDYESKPKSYAVLGHQMLIYDQELAEALQFILPQHRQILFLSYFLNYTDIEIGRLLGISNYAVRIRRAAALRRLQDLLEGKGYE